MRASEQRWLSTAQRYRIGWLLHSALIDIRIAARAQDLEPVRLVAASLRDLPVDMWRADCDVTAARASLRQTPKPKPTPAWHRISGANLARALADIAVVTPPAGGGVPLILPVVIEAATDSGAWEEVARCTNHPRTVGAWLESAARPWPPRFDDPLFRRPVRAIDTRTGRVVSADMPPLPEGPDADRTGLLTNAQRLEVCRLVGMAFADIQRAAEWGDNEAVHELADLTHNLTREMWWSRFYLPVEQAEAVQARVPTIGGMPVANYADWMTGIIAMRVPELEGDVVNTRWVWMSPDDIE